MIFVILGTQDKSFIRLLEAIENLNLKEKIVVQAGFTKFESKKMQIFDLIEMKTFKNLIKEADLIITHGGVGSIIESIKNNKKIIAVPRLKQYNEHDNDHQLEIIEELAKQGYLIPVINLEDLKEAIKKSKTFKQKKFKSNSNNMIKLLETKIGVLYK